MKISLICTTYNEANSIVGFLTSLKKQTKQPDEVVIVDSKSTDETAQLITAFARQSNLKIKLFSKKTNRAQGRNLAISKASYNIIAVTDAGCILDKYWLERITKPLIEDKADTVAGYYAPLSYTLLQKAIAPFVCVMPKNFNPETFLPSSRSVAFTKSAWQRAGKYPKHLNYCEDLVFASKLKENTLMMVQPKAIVYWEQKKTFHEFFYQIKNYARGDVEANYTPHLKKIASIFLRYVLFILIPPLLPLYLVFPILKHKKNVDNLQSLLYLPSLQITSDFAVMKGAIQGLVTTRKIILKPIKFFIPIPVRS